MADSKPLLGIRILDLTIWQQGPYATAVLADLGADVIKVEERTHGDPGRGAWVAENGLSAYFEAHNRGKRSIALDLKSAGGREALLKLCEGADALVTNFRARAMRNLRLEYGDIAAANPRIIYVMASGYGIEGPDSDLGAFDFLAQGRGGFASTNGEPDDPPIPAQVPLADQVGALHATIAVLSGIAARERTGRGARYDTSLLGSQLSLQSFDITSYLFTRQLRGRQYRGGSRPFWKIYRGSDDKWFVIGMLLERAWPELCHELGRADLLTDPRFDSFRKRIGDHANELIALLDVVFAAAPAREWVERLNRVGMFAQMVQSYDELESDPQVLANAYIHDVPREGHAPVPLVGTGIAVDGQPMRIDHLAPQLGEHTEEILLEAGYSWEEIEALCREGEAGPSGA
jgi:crotonobetainyl-CoA:carnitine CoA-transferase CaiB-like acyl-CoA transferase